MRGRSPLWHLFTKWHIHLYVQTFCCKAWEIPTIYVIYEHVGSKITCSLFDWKINETTDETNSGHFENNTSTANNSRLCSSTGLGLFASFGSLFFSSYKQTVCLYVLWYFSQELVTKLTFNCCYHVSHNIISSYISGLCFCEFDFGAFSAPLWLQNRWQNDKMQLLTAATWLQWCGSGCQKSKSNQAES